MNNKNNYKKKHLRACRTCGDIFKTYTICSKTTCDKCKFNNIAAGLLRRKINNKMKLKK